MQPCRISVASSTDKSRHVKAVWMTKGMRRTGEILLSAARTLRLVNFFPTAVSENDGKNAKKKKVSDAYGHGWCRTGPRWMEHVIKKRFRSECIDRRGIVKLCPGHRRRVIKSGANCRYKGEPVFPDNLTTFTHQQNANTKVS